MEVTISNSTYINNSQDENNLGRSDRIILNSDLDISMSSNSNHQINKRNKSKKINNNNIQNNSNAEDNNDNNNNNANNDNYNIYINNINLYKKKLTKMLKNENFVFFREYYNQKLDENNDKYISWLKELYIKIYHPNERKLGLDLKNLANQKIEIPDYLVLKEKIENKLIYCMNPYCNCIAYMNRDQKGILRDIKNIIFKEESWFYKGKYKKTRCPICLKYTCNFCNRSSTLLNANCCYRQLITAYGEEDGGICDYYSIFCCLFLWPIIRVFYMACLINFSLFRGITRKDKLLQSIENISRMTSNGMHSDVIFAPYQSKFKKVPMIIIGLLNIFGSILWAFPYFLYIEIFLNVGIFTCCCVEKYCLCLMITNYFYLLAFIPGLRKNETGKILFE